MNVMVFKICIQILNTIINFNNIFLHCFNLLNLFFDILLNRFMNFRSIQNVNLEIYKSMNVLWLYLTHILYYLNLVVLSDVNGISKNYLIICEAKTCFLIVP